MRSRLLLLLGLLPSILSGQMLRSFRLSSGVPLSFPPSNSMNEFVVSGDTLWAGSSRGPSVRISRFNRWEDLSGISPLKAGGVSGIAVNGTIAWVAYATSTKQDNESIPTGD